MKKAIFALLALNALAGCSTWVSHPDVGSSAATDEVWYVKEKYILMLFKTDGDVFYCPPAQAAGQKTCKKAVMHDE
jgi:hypothetical protein